MAFLQSISNCLKKDIGLALNPEEVAYFIRQINIGMGCFHQCAHCFSNPPKNEVEIMSLDSFSRITEEIGVAITKLEKVSPFLFLGSATDPAMIDNFARYAEVWIKALPIGHPVKFYTHGWNLTNDKQCLEFSEFTRVLSKYSSRISKMAVSFDFFSYNAIKNKNSYIQNVINNLAELKKCVHPQSLRLNVVYPTERLETDGKYTIGYWRNLAENNKFPNTKTMEHDLLQIKTASEAKCYELTKAIFDIGEKLGYNKQEIAKIATDGGVPIPVGKAGSFYKDSSIKTKNKALKQYKDHALSSLCGYNCGTKGLFILPNGSIRLIDYDGYKLGVWLNRKQPLEPLKSYRKRLNMNEFTIR